MALISTATIDNFTSGGTIDASTVIAAFDTIYDEVNGGLNAANLASTFTLESSSVTINETQIYFSATLASDVGIELTHKGWNSIHIIGLSTGGFDVFPGAIEINGNYCRLNSRLHFGGVGDITFNVTSTQKVWLLTVQPEAVLTASDFALIEYTGTDTADYDIDKNGWYFSASQRVLCSMRCDITGSTNDSFFDDEFFQRPSIGHRYLLEFSEANSIGFAVGPNRTSQVFQVFDMDTNRYYYEAYFNMPSAIDLKFFPWRPDLLINGFILGIPDYTASTLGIISPSGSVQHHFYIEKAQLFNATASAYTHNGGNFFNAGSLNTTIASLNLGSDKLTTETKLAGVNGAKCMAIIKRRIDSHRRT